MPAYQAKKTQSKRPSSSPARPGRLPKLSRGAMVTDVCLVAVWGATIPGLMWLGAAGGF
ncbi:hypothetical protein [Candidimonas sp. SYP-B2681]|uniref:hypothetical protein n=1 Tax=Candidimonas sp. SYP-B2681 TaxID=2497686 RepID=UPI0013155867|nr:hypothetical protein [Candidimonas sp. SYP-B2681]